jgi:hypothetical protein
MSGGRVKEGCEHSCSDIKELMNPNPKLWGALPGELLQMVFAHLPVHEISRLQFLSKEWRQIVSSPDFHRVRNEVYPKLVCFITRVQHGAVWVRVLDRLHKWHCYELLVRHPDVDWTAAPAPNMFVACEDGGLVCFVSNMEKQERQIWFLTVVNHLTRTSHRLPPLYGLGYSYLVRMQVDRGVHAFKVFVFARDVLMWVEGEEVSTHLYDSLTGEWMTTYGCKENLPDEGKLVEYSFATGQLFNIDDDFAWRPWKGEGYDENRYARTDSTFYRDRLFVLQLGLDGPANGETANQSPMYYIEEFRWETVWVKDKTHRCEPFEHPPETISRMKLRACHGYLMVVAKLESNGANKSSENRCAWLYDLSTQKWSTLDPPQLPASRRTHDLLDYGIYQVDLMFEPQWGV